MDVFFDCLKKILFKILISEAAWSGSTSFSFVSLNLKSEFPELCFQRKASIGRCYLPAALDLWQFLAPSIFPSVQTHHSTGNLANTIPCFKEVMSSRHTRRSCQLHNPNRLQAKEVRNSLHTPGNTHKAFESHQCCSRCPATLQTFTLCLSLVWLGQFRCPKALSRLESRS